MRILCTSDLHGQWGFLQMPEADVLVIAGDLTTFGRLDEVVKFNEALLHYPIPTKIVIAGNHDWAFYNDTSKGMARRLITNAHYLEDSGVVLDGVKFWGSPWTPQLYDWAFMLPRWNMFKKWDLIPNDTDVLITHGPPAGQRDSAYQSPEPFGCEALRDAVQRVRPKLHIFGHVHEAYGTSFNEHTGFVNCCRCNRAYNPVNDPILVEV